MADFLDAKVKEIEGRLKELRPLLEEYHRLEAAAAALNGVDGHGTRGRGRGAGARANGSRRGRPRGARGENTRAAQAVELVRARPGITIPELAEHMGIKPNYLYRILPQLEEEGKVRREDKGWLPA
ncbi:helix-turn-helix domain-containing protein [Conexibacter arvalis]|uniref:Putative Rossmann fold nucleotide-binding protein DprA/Smf involved in DNA uptake n=1 Tax=Conexibacter arvalis TaxID=912552 RepID=A0A840I9V4_9ACTN|nr:putative Rossmann fold nucleotide-binding protein DprA/Smf involved in DNA uptake [Conexibacter arvalis]